MEKIDRLKQIQKHYDLNDADFARRIGITKQAWYNIKTGEYSVSDKVLVSVVAGFPGVDARWIITGEGSLTGVNIFEEILYCLTNEDFIKLLAREIRTVQS